MNDSVNDTNPWLKAGKQVAATMREQAEAAEASRELTAPEPDPSTRSAAEPVAAAQPAPPLTGAVAPQKSVTAPGPGEGGLPVRMVRPTAGLWVVGAHGGAGESTLARLDLGWAETGHAWPTPSELSTRCPTVLVARTNAAGLRAAQRALRQWASGVLGPQTDLLGLVLLADGPGRLPKPLRALVDLVSGGAPRTWQIGWVEDWRAFDPADTPAGRPAEADAEEAGTEVPQLNRQLGRLVTDLSTLLAQLDDNEQTPS